MKLINNSKRTITILSVLVGIVYTITVSQTLFQNGRLIIDTVKGNRQVSKESQKSKLFALDLESKDAANFYSDSLYNNMSKKMVPVHIHEAIITENNVKSHWYDTVINIITFLLFFPILFRIIRVPILFYNLIISLYRGNVFELSNVQKIKKIGLYQIHIFLYGLITIVYDYFSAKMNIDFSNYSIVLSDLKNELLIMGLVALIFANVLNRAILMKEEQELTI